MIKQQIDLENQLEEVKKDLSFEKDFNLFDAFKYLDVNHKGWLTFEELVAGLEGLGLRVN